MCGLSRNKKLGCVSIREIEENKWQVRWWNANTKKYIRRILPTRLFDEALGMATNINSDIANGKGFLPSMRKRSE